MKDTGLYTTGHVVRLSIGFLVACLASIYWIDRPLCVFIHENLPSVGKRVGPGATALEIAFGFPVSKYLLGFAGLAIGLIFYVVDKNVKRANLFFFLALTHIVSRLTAGVLKNVFLRARPYEFLAGSGATKDFWISGGSSFPSGHAVHFFGLFLPLVFLYPKQSVWLVVPVFVGVSRVLENDHYLSDVLTSVYIAYFFTFVFARLFRIRSREGDKR